MILTPLLESRLMAVLHDMHRTATIWYGYLVGASVALKAMEVDITGYLSVAWQHWILGGATFLMIADKLRRSIGATVPDPVIPPPAIP